MTQTTDKQADATCDVVIRNGQVFDGADSPAVTADVAIDDGKVQAVGRAIAARRAAARSTPRGCWVMPGMLDIHTHYDAEVEAMPGLEESVRHGVTTIVMGNCSLSAALGEKKDILDLFCRVESLPRDVLSQWLGDDRFPGTACASTTSISINCRWVRTWPASRAFQRPLPRDGHGAQPEGEQGRAATKFARCKRIVDEAIDEGYLGLSIDMLPWHRLDGEPFRGISVPSQHAHPNEYRSLAEPVARRRDRVLQATPNALTKSTVAMLGMLSTGVGRKPLRTTIVAAMDVKTNRTHLQDRHHRRHGAATSCSAPISAGRLWPSRS